MTEPTLPTWDEMTDLDKGVVLLHLSRRDWEGAETAVEHYPARYHDHPALVALSPREASEHAASMQDAAAEVDDAVYERLYEAAKKATEVTER